MRMVEEEDRSQDRDPHFVRACAVEMHFNMSQEPLYTEIYQKNAAPQKRDPHTLCEPAQSKCMSTFRKSHFIWQFTGKMRDQSEHPDQAPAFTYCKNPSVWTHVLGKKQIMFWGLLGSRHVQTRTSSMPHGDCKSSQCGKDDGMRTGRRTRQSQTRCHK